MEISIDDFNFLSTEVMATAATSNPEVRKKMFIALCKIIGLNWFEALDLAKKNALAGSGSENKS